MRVSQTLFASLLLLPFAPLQAEVVPLDAVVVEVNNDIITESELQKRIDEIRRQLISRKTSAPPADQLRQGVLDRMVIDQLQLSRAGEFGLTLSESQLNDILESIATKNKMTLTQLRETLIREGLDYKEFREKIRRDTIIQRLQKGRVFDSIKVTDQEIDQFLINQQTSKDTRYLISHILINTPEAASSEELQTAKTKAEAILKQLQSGDSFEELAIKKSAGHNALEGGDLGWRTASELPVIFVQAVSKLEPGQISGILQSPSGYHILKLNDKQAEQKVVIQETLARHILIKPDAITKDDDVRQQLSTIRQQILDGADFAELAKKFSQDPGSKGKGGELGWSAPGLMVQQFDDVMNSLQIKQLSEPFQTQFGWHIVQVLDRRQSDKTEIVVRNKAYQAIQRSKADEALQLWLRELRDQAFIKYHNDADKPET